MENLCQDVEKGVFICVTVLKCERIVVTKPGLNINDSHSKKDIAFRMRTFADDLKNACANSIASIEFKRL